MWFADVFVVPANEKFGRLALAIVKVSTPATVPATLAGKFLFFKNLSAALVKVVGNPNATATALCLTASVVIALPFIIYQPLWSAL